MEKTNRNLNSKLPDCEVFYFSLIESSDHLIWLVDKQYRLICGNPAFQNHVKLFFGRNIGEGESFPPGIPEINSGKWPEYYKKVFSTGAGFIVETENYQQTGKTYFEYTLSPVMNADGQIIAVSVIGRDTSKQKELESLLLHRNEMLRRNERTTLSGSWEWDMEKKTMFWTDQVFFIHDFEPEIFPPGSADIISRSFQCYFPEDRRLIEKAFNDCCQKGYPYDLELRFLTKNGRKLWVRTSGEPIFKNGKVVKVAGNIQDITIQKGGEEALRNSEIKFRSLVEQASEMLFLHDMQGKIIDVNRAAIQQTGYSREELLKMYVFDIDPGSVIRRDHEMIWNSLNNSAEQRLEVWHRKKDGTNYNAEVCLSKINLGENEFILALAHDITKRKKEENEIRENEQRFRDLLKGVRNVSIQGYAADGTTIYWNLASEQLYGYTTEEALGRNMMELIIPPEIKEVAAKVFKRMMDTGNPIRDTELLLMRKDGARVPVFSNLFIFQLPGKESELYCFDVDLTELKTAEKKMLDINAQKDKFLSIIAHDLKNPFNAILGFSDLLMDQVKEKDFEGIEQYAGIILQSSQRAMDLIINLTEWSRAETGRMPFKPEIFGIETLVSENCLLFADIADRKKISVKKISTDIHYVRADKAMIGTVLRNLISNAIKFTHPGGEITITTEEGKNGLLVSVSDTGVGIPREQVGSLFRIDSDISTPGTLNEKGTGLGLILCKEFVDKHGGEIGVESELGKGSRFWFLLPVDSLEEDLKE
jgi:PAS domain S-box-containing protein